MLWTHFESFVCSATGSNFDIFSSPMSLHVSSAYMYFIYQFSYRWRSAKSILMTFN